jgi:hypothetical protein
VEICGLKKEVLLWDVSELQKRLKDFFFPQVEVYIVFFVSSILHLPLK